MKKLIKKNWIYMICICIFLFIIRIPMLIGVRGLVQNTGGDEFGTLFGATILTDLDWSVAVKKNSYYGVGYSILLTPFFQRIQDTEIIMKFCMFSNSVCLCISGMLCYNIVKRFLGSHKEKENILITIAAVCLPSNLIQLNSFTNEASLYLIMWSLIYILLMLSEENKDNRKVWSVLLVCLLLYGMTIHTRMIFLIGFAGVYIISYGLIKKRCIIDIPLCMISGMIIGFLVFGGIRYIENTYFIGEGQKIINNSVSSAARSVKGIFEKIKGENLTEILKVFHGQIFSAISLTMGMIIVSIYGALKQISYVRKREGQTNSFQILYISLFFLWIIIVAMFSIKQGGYIVKHPSENFSKYYTYVRYQNICMQPFILMGIMSLYKDKKFIMQMRQRKVIGKIYLFVLFLLDLFLLIHNEKLNLIKNTSSHAFYDYIAFQFLGKDENFSLLSVTMYCLIILCLIFILFELIKRRKLKLMLIMCICMYLFCYEYTSLIINIPNSNESKEYHEQILGLVNKDEFEHIYMKTRSYTDFCSMQFYLYNQKLEDEIPENIKEKSIIIVKGSKKERDKYESKYSKARILLNSEEMNIIIMEVKGMQL